LEHIFSYIESQYIESY